MDNSEIDITKYDYVVVGAGISGSTIAERLVNCDTCKVKNKVLVIDKRSHLAGNCYDYIDKTTNIRISKYGPHFFHTNDVEVWNYVNMFSKWIRWEHKALSYVESVNKCVSIPVNITTINELCNENIENSEDVKEWLSSNQIKYDEIINSEEMAKSRVGEKLYKLLIEPYTYKQWNKMPKELDASVLARIPIRDNFDSRYFSDKYQALPEDGYTKLVENMLDNPNITVSLNTDFFKLRDYYKNKVSSSEMPTIIYTGPIDSYFQNLPKLEYRSLEFKKEIYYYKNYYQTNSVVNHPDIETPYTRITEYKHILNQKSPHTIIFKEYSSDTGEPYYPVPTKRNRDLYDKYKLLADEEEEKYDVHFLGRLANYKYFNMDQAIKNALDYYELHFDSSSTKL